MAGPMPQTAVAAGPVEAPDASLRPFRPLEFLRRVCEALEATLRLNPKRILGTF